MANTFKLKTKNAIGTGSATVYTVPSSTTTVMIGCSIANRTINAIQGSVLVSSDTSDTESNEDVYIVRNAPIPAGSSLEVMSGNKVVLQTTDIVKINSDSSGSLDASVSIMEIS